MPGRKDIHTILIVGSGPIVIGQAAEFDYSGTQAIKALRRQGYRLVLVNSNPATVMTEPDLADATYIEPLVPEALRAIIAQEKPDAFLPTVGGQTGLNLALALSEDGTLADHQVQLIGASLKAIRIAEDRERFRQAMIEAGVPVPRGGAARSLEEARALAGEIGYPLLVRASFALGGSGAGWVKCPEELPEAAGLRVGVADQHRLSCRHDAARPTDFGLRCRKASSPSGTTPYGASLSFVGQLCVTLTRESSSRP